jgi:hypothetical protein
MIAHGPVRPEELIALIERGAIGSAQKNEDGAFARIYRGYSLSSLDDWVRGLSILCTSQLFSFVLVQIVETIFKWCTLSIIISK